MNLKNQSKEVEPRNGVIWNLTEVDGGVTDLHISPRSTHTLSHRSGELEDI